MSERGEYSLKYHRVRLKVYLIFFIVSKFEEMETVCLGNHAAEEKKQENVDNLREVEERTSCSSLIPRYFILVNIYRLNSRFAPTMAFL